ncbi:MAG TPA: hypothetical protein VER04_24865, partial [Polyangiaceae bacterium]|nr:hypothetical protein [Polyangiaceae bacterium]
MRRRSLGRSWRALPLALFAVVGWSCANDLTKNLDGKQCNANFDCSSGYQCDRISLLCERIDPDAGICGAGKVECDSGCTELASDPNNCGGCGATCSAPAHGVAVCLAGKCSFVCPDRAACGDVCVDFQSDSENCGACGQTCNNPLDGQARCVAGK